jgi:hypothetical protein
MKRILTLISLIAIASAATAQEQLKVGDVLDLEERILIKQMNDELAKPNPHAPMAPPVFIQPKAPKIVYPTVTLAVYGTSATAYEGQLSMGGRVYTVRRGSPVQEYTVASIAPHGIELSKNAATGLPGKVSARTPKIETIFAPLASH